MPTTVSFCGRPVTQAELGLIRDITLDFPALSVAELSKTICELLNWRRSAGGPQKITSATFSTQKPRMAHVAARAADHFASRPEENSLGCAQLEALQARVTAEKLKAQEKIGAAAGTILGRNHGSRYYDWELKDGQFRFCEYPLNLKNEEALEGKCFIQSEEPNLSALEAVAIYKELSEVERAFSGCKDVVDMRPIYHQKTHRTEAHIFVASLAFLLDRALEKKLKSAGIDLSSKEAWELLKTIRVVDIDLGNGERKRSVTQGSGRAARILKIVGIRNLDPDARKAKDRAA